MDVDVPVEASKAAWSEEETTQNVLSTAQLAVDGSIPVLDAINKLKINLSEGIEGGSCTKDRWKAIYASAIWILGTQISSQGEGEEFPRKNFVDLVKDSIAHDLMDSALLKATLELSTLAMLGLIKDEDGHQKRLVKLNTGVVYKQQKYNLEREETEGYAKLIVLLRNMPTAPAEVDAVVQSVLAIIGQFDLEPNRVMDIVLDCFEQQPRNLSFVVLLKRFKPAYIVHVLGFKFGHYQARVAGDGASPSPSPSGYEVVPPSLTLLAATLVTQQLVELDALLPYLTPSLEETAAALKAKEDAVRKHLQSMSGLNDFLSGVQPPVVAAAAASEADGAAAAAPVASATLPRSADFLKQPLNLRTGSAWRRASTCAIVANASALKPSASHKPLTVSTSAVALAASAAAASTPSLGAMGRAQRQQEKEQRERERQQELEAEEAQLAAQLRLFDRSDMFSAEEADVRRHPVLSLAAALLQTQSLDAAMVLLRALQAQGVSMDFLLAYSKPLRQAMAALALGAVQPLTRSLRHTPHLCGPKAAVLSELTPAAVGGAQPAALLTELQGLPALQESLLQALSYHVSTSTALFTALAALLKTFIEAHYGLLLGLAQSLEAQAQRGRLPPRASDEDEAQRVFRTASALAQQLLLALSTSGADATFLSAQLWRALSLLPYPLRFRIYDAHRAQLAAPGVGLGVSVAVRAATKDIKNELKRLTKDNPKPTALKLAKLLQSHAVSAAAAFLALVESFDNFIPYCVEALRTLSDQARDLFAHAFLCELHEKEAQRNDAEASQEGRPTPAWFAALARFIAAFYGRYPGTELRGLLAYLLRSLAAGRVGDLLLLRELVTVMGGVDSLRELSATQLEGLSGGRVLRAEVLGAPGATTTIAAGATGGATSHQLQLNQQRRAAAALRDTLLSSQTALPAVLFVARLRDKAVTDEAVTQLKVASALADLAQDLLLQLADFLVLDVASSSAAAAPTQANAKALEAVARALPSFATLLGELRLAPALCFQLLRPLFRTSLLPPPAAAQKTLAQWQLFGDSVGAALRDCFEREHGRLYGALDGEDAPDDAADATRAQQLRRWWALPPERFVAAGDGTDAAADGDADATALSPLERLYLWFWGLALSDVTHPADRYAAEARRIADRVAEVEQRKTHASAATLNLSSADFKKWQKARDAEIAPLRAALVALTDEAATQRAQAEALRERLSRERDAFLPRDWQQSPRLAADWLVQTLLLPRLSLGAAEAVYCVKFVRLCHDVGVRGLHLLAVFDAVLRRVLGLVYAATEAEAACLGHALQEILATAARWQRSMQLYDAELKVRVAVCCPAASLAPAAAAVALPGAPQGELSEAERAALVQAAASSYTKYLQLCRLWQTTLLAALLRGLGSREFIYLRCAMTLLSRVVEFFPSRRSDGQTLLARVDALAGEEKNERGDLQLMARSLAVRLRKQSAAWTNDLIASAAGAKGAAKPAPKMSAIAKESLARAAPAAATAATGGASATAAATAAPTAKSTDAPPAAKGQPPAARSGGPREPREREPRDRDAARDAGRDSGRDAGRGRDGRDGRDSRDTRDTAQPRDRDGRQYARPPPPPPSQPPVAQSTGGPAAAATGSLKERLAQGGRGAAREPNDGRESGAKRSRPADDAAATTAPAGASKAARTDADRDARSSAQRQQSTSGGGGGGGGARSTPQQPPASSSSQKDGGGPKAPASAATAPRPQHLRGNSQPRDNVRHGGGGGGGGRPPPPPLPANPPPPASHSGGYSGQSNGRGGSDFHSRDGGRESGGQQPRDRPPPPPGANAHGGYRQTPTGGPPGAPPPPPPLPRNGNGNGNTGSNGNNGGGGGGGYSSGGYGQSYPPNKRPRR